MNTNNCECRINCTIKALAAGIIIGIVTAILRYTAFITLAPAFLWVLFSIAVGFLGITLIISSFCNAGREYCCQNLSTFLAGILGTVLTSVILLGITFAATSVIGAIVAGLLLFFFTLTLVGAACLIRCRYSCD